MASPSPVLCIDTDLPPAASCGQSSRPVLVQVKVVRQVCWTQKNKTFLFQKHYVFKRVIFLNPINVVVQKVTPRNHLALFSLGSYQCARHRNLTARAYLFDSRLFTHSARCPTMKATWNSSTSTQSQRDICMNPSILT